MQPGMALPWWLATTACSARPAAGFLAGQLAFLFLGAVDLAFVAACLVLAARRPRSSGDDDDDPVGEAEALLPKPSSLRSRHLAAAGASSVLAASSAVLLVLALQLLPPWESAFLAAHAVAHGAAAWTAVASSGRLATHLRSFWLASALGAALASAPAAFRGALLLPDDALALAAVLVSLPLAYAAVAGRAAPGGEDDADATPYAAATFLSRATFSWINPLISKGYAAGSLAAADVPPVSAVHRAQASHALFTSNWPGSSSRHPVGVALWLSFWPQLLLTAVLGLVQMAGMYVGPSLIDRFVEFVRRGGAPREGLRLVLALLAGKAAQTLASHHYNFQGQLLGLRIRGALQTALYRKSLRLSAAARRAHGAGAVVSYVQVDASMVSSAMHGLHGLWLMPLQILVALLLLYAYLGPAVFMTLAVIAGVTVITAFANKLNLGYQLKFFAVRDSRIKAVTEMLNSMRVIKLQAWEETFGDKVRRLREDEVGWVRRFMLFMCANNVVFSSGPLAMTVLVFGTYLASGGELDAGKVFTATAFFSMLDGPMRNFPQTIITSMQAFVSLGRLNKFLTDAEIDAAAVERVAGGALAVKVERGVFAWDVPPPATASLMNGRGKEPEMETVLKGVNVEVRKGELAAVVGTVGSGKSSLLSCIMGEMQKVSGKVSVRRKHSISLSSIQ
jgi:ATP-binding cassette, subfamily C (CFTR/MRP), member 1